MEDHSSDICLNESMEEVHSFLDMELETLQSIYINELKVKADEKCTTVSIDLHPSTADKLDEQYVRMTLQFTLEEEYPEKIPGIKIRNPRGLSEEKINFIVKDLLAIAENKKGSSMLFEMIDAAKEHLTVGNRPSGECAICLYGFSEKDVFTKTECYHYFHTHCLARYTKNFIENSEDFETDSKSKSISNELLCPMCRVPIQFSGLDSDYPPPEESGEGSFVLTEEIVDMQRKMADLFKKQVEKGGIIDIEAEKNKYLLEISNVPTRTYDENSEQKLVAEGESEAESKVEASEQVDSPSNDRKEFVKERYQRHDYRGKNRNYNNRHGESRGNHRYDQKFNRHSYDNSRGSYNSNKPVKNNQISSHEQSEESDLPVDDVKDLSTQSDSVRGEDVSRSQELHDNASETSDQPLTDVRSKHNSSSPRYNRGYRRGNSYGNHDRNSYGNYTSHPGHRRSDKSNYYESQNPQASHRYSSNRNAELSAGDSEERCKRDQRTFDDGGENRKPNYRSNVYKHDDDFNSRERYSDSRNPQRRGKGAYNRRDNYSNASNNYPRNRYSDRDQYQAERDNFRGRRNYYSDNRHKGGDKSYYDDHNRQSSRNYSGNRRGKYTDKSADSTNRECSESVPLTQTETSDSYASNAPSVELECSSKRFPNSSKSESKPLQNKEVSDFGEKCSDKVTDAKPAQDGMALSTFPNVFNENPQVKTRTVNPPPGFANPLKKVIYGLQGANPPPGFNRS